jgi:hypothetical protein
MRYWIYSLIILASLVGGSAAAADREDRKWEDEAQIELQIQAPPQRYTFQDYMSDLKASTRIDQMDLDNRVRQLESRKNQKYEPPILNPFPILRW